MPATAASFIIKYMRNWIIGPFFILYIPPASPTHRTAYKMYITHDAANFMFYPRPNVIIRANQCIYQVCTTIDENISDKISCPPACCSVVQSGGKYFADTPPANDVSALCLIYSRGFFIIWWRLHMYIADNISLNYIQVDRKYCTDFFGHFTIYKKMDFLARHVPLNGIICTCGCN